MIQLEIGGNCEYNDDKVMLLLGKQKESIYQNIAAAFKLVLVVQFDLFITGFANIFYCIILEVTSDRNLSSFPVYIYYRGLTLNS